MSVLLKTRVTAIGPEVADLAEAGVVILFADGSPPELAEVSVLHRTESGPSDDAPAKGASIAIGGVSATITAVGPSRLGQGARDRPCGHQLQRRHRGRAAGRDLRLRGRSGGLVAELKAGAVIVVAAA